MVRRAGLAAALLACGGLAAGPLALSPTAQALSPSAQALSTTAQPLSATADLPALPGRPAPLKREPNVGWEDFTAVTLVSAPFTAFWSLVGALAVGGIAQRKFPPEIDTPLIAGAATVAGVASVSIGLVSVQWGGPKKARAQDKGSIAP